MAPAADCGPNSLAAGADANAADDSEQTFIFRPIEPANTPRRRAIDLPTDRLAY